MDRTSPLSTLDTRTQGWINGFIGVVIFSGSLPATRLAVMEFDPVFLTLIRAAIAGLLGLALLWLRHTDKHTTRPFKVPLYPVLPLIFCAACAWLTYSSVTYAISQNAIHVSMGLIASGIFALLILRGREKNL